MESMTLKVGSLFSGIAGLDRGLEDAGMEIAWQCEIDPKARMILRRHYPDIPCYEDVTTLKGSDVEPVDLLAFGSPCQSLSVSGKREGLNGEKSRLFFEAVRLLDELRPQWFLWENVAGLVSSHNGADMATALGILSDIGYGFSWRLLCASALGVPQRRRRIITVGYLGDNGERAAAVLLEPEGGDWDFESRRKARTKLASVPKDGAGTSGVREVVAALTATGVGTCGADDNQAQAGHLIPDTVPALTTRCGNTQDDQQVGQLVPVSFHLTQDPITSEEVFPAMGAGNAHGCPTMGVGVPVSFSERAEVVESDIAHQLSGPGGKPGYAAIHLGLAARRLTERECEKLQGLPLGADGHAWTEFGVDDEGNLVKIAGTHRYRGIGNAVAVPMAAWVGRRIVDVEASQRIEETA
jgi:DNA (cytosine-5)-methyltransferase 1